MENWWLFIILFFLLLIIFPLFFKVYFTYNPKTNLGMMVVKLWFVKIVFFSFQLKHTGIIIRTKKQRKQVEYAFGDPRLQFFEHFMMKIKEKIYVKYVDIYSKIGTGNAVQSAVMSSIFLIIFKTLVAYVKNSKPKTKADINAHTAFNEDVFIFSLYGELSISILMIIQSFFATIFKANR